jgi:hypothetical protein
MRGRIGALLTLTGRLRPAWAARFKRAACAGFVGMKAITASKTRQNA